MRFGRPAVPNFTSPDQKFEIGKAVTLKEGKDVTIIATGHLVWKALVAQDILAHMGVSAEVINIHTIKPLDEFSIFSSVQKTKCLVTAEEHMRNGGLGESIASLLTREPLFTPIPIEMIAIDDQFGQSGTPEELMEKYGLTAVKIIEAAERVIRRK